MKKADFDHNKTLTHRIWHRLVGEPRNINEPSLFYKISLIPILAWIGLGADGLSSSSYGPEEAFKALQQLAYLLLALIDPFLWTRGVPSTL